MQVSIPLRKIKGANQSKNAKKTSQKFMEIVKMDNFDFWFMGVRYCTVFYFIILLYCESYECIYISPICDVLTYY